MAGSSLTYQRMWRAFRQLGIDLALPDENGLINFEYDGYPFILVILEEEESFYLYESVVGPFGNIDKRTFEDALEATQQTYESVDGYWGEEHSFITSELYSLRNSIFLPKRALEAIISQFFEAHTLMEWNVFMLLNPSAWPGKHQGPIDLDS